MLVATFSLASTLAGKTITHAQGRFLLEDSVELTPQQVLDFDDKGELDWAHEGMDGWVREMVSPPEPPAVVAPVAPPEAPTLVEPVAAPDPIKEPPGLAPPSEYVAAPAAPQPPRKSHRGRNIAIAVVVVVLLVGVVIAVTMGHGSTTGVTTGTSVGVATAIPTSAAASQGMSMAAFNSKFAATQADLMKPLAAVVAAGAAHKTIHDSTLQGAIARAVNKWQTLTAPAAVQENYYQWWSSLAIAYGDTTRVHLLALVRAMSALTNRGNDPTVKRLVGRLLVTSWGSGSSSGGSSSSATTVTVQPTVSPSKAYKNSCRSITYKVLNKDADFYVGRRFKLTGQIFQIQDAGSGQYWEGYPNGIQPETTILMSVTNMGYGIWDNNVAVAYDGRLSKIYEKNIITVWGTCEGQFSYTSVAGYNMTVPLIHARYVDKK